MAKTNVVWEPCSNTQYKILVDETPLIGLFSGRGTGKSQVAVLKSLMNIGKFGSDYRILVLRETYPALNDLKMKFEWFLERLYKDQYSFNGKDYRFTFKSGEIIQFSYLDQAEKGLEKILGHEYQFIIIDEVVSIPNRGLIEKALMTLRSANPDILKQVIVLGNPRGRGFSFCKKEFYSVPYGDLYKSFGLKAKSYYLKIEDNPFIYINSPEYVEMLDSLSPALRAAWREGLWVQDNETIFFDMFDEKIHVVKPFELPDHWKISRGLDWGSSSPFSYNLMAEAAEDFTMPDGRVIREGSKLFIKEWYGATKESDFRKGLRLTAPEMANEIISKEHEWGYYGRIEPGGCDIAVFSTSGFADSVGEYFEKVGVEFSRDVRKGKGSREAGWEIIKSLMRETTKPTMEESCMIIFDDCPQLIREIKEIMYDTKKTNDCDTTMPDHALDSIRAMVSLNESGGISTNRGY